MIRETKVLVRLNGKNVVATVTVDLPNVDKDDHINADMVLKAVASGQRQMNYISRHNPRKSVTCIMDPTEEEMGRPAYPRLRRVA